MLIIWTILIVISLLCIIWCILSDEKMPAIFITIFFVCGLGWGLIGNLVDIKYIKYKVNNKVIIERTSTCTYLSYGDTELKLTDVKAYRFLTKENCDIYLNVKINMYHNITEKELIVEYKVNIE